jgi:D-alanine-D-alanine ligase-like ATP-grasp enzyme
MDPDHPDTWEVSAPLYVKYIPKKDEYRVHVVRGEIIDIQRKGLREELKGTEGVNFKVRNLANGFVFVRNDGRTVPECVLTVGRQAVQALELDFGAADVIYNAQQNRAYAIEVNSAPGLQGTTIVNYTNALRNL